MQLENITNLKIELIIPNPNQPRKYFDETSLSELAASIKMYGILNPILVRKKNDMYEIIAGERRYRAAKMVGLSEIPVIIKEIPEEKITEIAMIENIQRENINPIEEAKSYQEILQNNNITEKELSEKIGRSQPFVANKIRLLKLPKEVQEAIVNKQISEKHARSLLKINDSEKQKVLLEKIINLKLSVKELDEIINKEILNNKKEEKESDNMNNGNFFPNLNNPQNSETMSLNTMNMQSINNTQLNPAPMSNNVPIQQPIMPEVPNIQNFNDAPVSNNMQQNVMNQMPQPIPPTETNIGINQGIPNFNPIPNQENEMNQVNAEITQESTPAFDIPLFNESNLTQTNNAPLEQNTQPPIVANSIENQPIQPDNQNQQSIPETPLFNQEMGKTIPTSNENISNMPAVNESQFEIPISTPQTTNNNQSDKLTQIQQLLSNNGIEFKTYSNETGHCIIIEF